MGNRRLDYDSGIGECRIEVLMKKIRLTRQQIPFAVLVAGCVGGAFNGIGAKNSTLAEPGNSKYSAEGQKVNKDYSAVPGRTLMSRIVLPYL